MGVTVMPTPTLPMKVTSSEFEQSALELEECPKWSLPEVALIGRSNVGKSSLVNLITARKDLARVSNTPGKTRLINFYVINRTWSLVDLPGYGYAEVSRTSRNEFNEAVARFILERRNLRRVFVLIDSRLPPQAIDREFVHWMNSEAVPYSLVFTKVDKQSSGKTQASIDRFIAAGLGSNDSAVEVLQSSATTKAGRTELLSAIERHLSKAPSA